MTPASAWLVRPEYGLACARAARAHAIACSRPCADGRSRGHVRTVVENGRLLPCVLGRGRLDEPLEGELNARRDDERGDAILPGQIDLRFGLDERLGLSHAAMLP